MPIRLLYASASVEGIVSVDYWTDQISAEGAGVLWEWNAFPHFF